MNIKETIEYLEKLLLDPTLLPFAIKGIKESIKKLKKDPTLETVVAVLEIIAALLGIGSHL